MTWSSITLETDCVHAEALSDALLEAGALSVSIEDAHAGTEKETPRFDEPGFFGVRDEEGITGWACSRVVALFEPEKDFVSLIARCAAQAGIGGTPVFIEEKIEEQDWVRLTQSQFGPIRISERLWIVPSWHEAPVPDAIVLHLDPGLAFGTGSHPTTRLCLEWLERRVHAGDSVLDYGCGSGILAIAAAKFGASLLLGVDIDPRAVDTARRNAARNEVAVRFDESSVKIDGQFDIVIANILSSPLKALAPAICAHVRPDGRLALSGILEEQADELISLYAQNGASLAVTGASEGWVCLSGIKAAP
ncbi:MAG: 50S ribosomal protein L11 methyltransferase [Candidatus Accumulibacter sp.]|nr:50S ribosomal protein L11 methyltransferase [Accumulibacter sp.]